MAVRLIRILVYGLHLWLERALYSQLLVDLPFQLRYLLKIPIQAFQLLPFLRLLLIDGLLEYGQPLQPYLHLTLEIWNVEQHSVRDLLDVGFIRELDASLDHVISELIVHHIQQVGR